MAYAYPSKGIKALNEEELVRYNQYIKMGYLQDAALGAAFNNVSPEVYISSTTAYKATNNTGLGTVTGTTNNENYGAQTMDINNAASSEDVNNAINEYNQAMKEYNDREYEYRQYVDQLAQKNWKDEFEFEKEKFRQQLKENELTRTREDSEYQRTMHDMALAGINPLMVGRLGTDSTSLGQVAGNAPGGPAFHGGTPSPIQSQAAAVASNLNSLRDYEIMSKQLKLDEEKIKEEQRQNKAKENIEKSKVLQQVRYWNNQLTQAGIELQNANMQAQNERELKEALQQAEHANKLIEMQTEFGYRQQMQKQEEEAKQKLQDSINKIQAINTGNKIVDTVVNLALNILRFLRYR